MSVTAPPRPPRSDEPIGRDEVEVLVEALIEEARQRTRRRRRRNAAVVVALLLGALAVYVGLSRDSDAGMRASGSHSADVATPGRAVRNGPLTIFTMDAPDGGYGVPTIRTVKSLGGTSKVIWRCPDGNVCNQAVSFDWAPDGRRLAFSLDQIGGNSWYVMGLHVVDLVAGSDRQIPDGAPKGTIRNNAARTYVQRIREDLGCWPAAGLEWSPDGTRLAYGCRGWPYPTVPRTFVAILHLDGSGLTTIATRGVLPRWPSWSPDGTRIAYSTGVRPSEHPSIYSVRLDGTHRRLVVENGTAPAWSPDGKTIAYWAGCGIRLVTPAGRDVTPKTQRPAGCDAIGRAGPPVWSPDGKKIAVEVSHRAPRAADGVYVMDADGANLERVSPDSTPTWYGDMPARPSWRPLP